MSTTDSRPIYRPSIGRDIGRLSVVDIPADSIDRYSVDIDAHDRPNVGKVSANCRPSAVKYRPGVGRHACRLTSVDMSPNLGRHIGRVLGKRNVESGSHLNFAIARSYGSTLLKIPPYNKT